MKVYRFFAKVLALALLCSCSWTFVLAQSNTSAASVSRARAGVSSGPYTPSAATSSQYPSSGSYSVYTAAPPAFRIPDEIVVDEFVNYHKHRLPLPKAGQAVALDTRWGSGEISRSQREAVLQIGFATAEVNERTDLRPLNLVLVIDKSGSMAGDKMVRVKNSLHTMVGQLRGSDIVSIVAFDSMAEVL
ncbi:MAG TPA: VWA domain-containing protein, partial [Pyrinomonadaceae bacterium]|nr:VWA domain-containing protein [Pyrinomonadaceae bacterium]